MDILNDYVLSHLSHCVKKSFKIRFLIGKMKHMQHFPKIFKEVLSLKMMWERWLRVPKQRHSNHYPNKLKRWKIKWIYQT